MAGTLSTVVYLRDSTSCVLLPVFVCRLFAELDRVDLISSTEKSFGGSNNNQFYPYAGAYLSASYAEFPERAMGFLMMNTDRPVVQALAVRYIAVYVRQLQDVLLGRYVRSCCCMTMYW